MSIAQTLERVLELSRADDCIVIGRHLSKANVRWALNTATTNGVSEHDKLFVISVIDGRVGTIERSQFPPQQLESLVRASEAACAGKPPAEDAMPLLGGNSKPDDWFAAPALTSIGLFANLAADLAGAFRRAAQARTPLFGFAEHVRTTEYVATSSGLRRRFSWAEGKVQVNAKTADFKSSAWTGRVTSTFQNLSVEQMEQRLRERLDWSRKLFSLPAGRYEVLLEPSAVADMLLHTYFSMSARDADEGRSVFSKPGGGNRIGAEVAPPEVTLYSDPGEPGFQVSPFVVAEQSSSWTSVFDNGLSARRTYWIRGGALSSLVTTRHWAGLTGTEPSPIIANLILPAAGPTLEEMIASTKRALLVTCFWYIREVDPQTLLLTGVTRDGVFLVEDGEVKGAVNNFRFNMSPLQMLRQIVEIGRSQPALAREFGDFFAFVKMPPLRVQDFHMSAVSPAV